MKVNIFPSLAQGNITVPPSKSMAHRLLICAALAKSKSRIEHVELSEDIQATLQCLAALGLQYTYQHKTVKMDAVNFLLNLQNPILDCQESGSTLRFLLPLAFLSGTKVTYTGAPRLLERPLSVYEKLFADDPQIQFQKNDEKISVKGILNPGNFSIEGNISSQFISGLLFVLPLLKGRSQIEILKPIESKSYIDLTLDALQQAGIKINHAFENEKYWLLQIAGEQNYQPLQTAVEGDYSNAAFFGAFNFLNGQVNCLGLKENSLQGDRIFTDLFAQIMAREPGDPEISLANCPDLAPICFVMAALSKKTNIIFKDTRRLAIKESKRADVMAEELAKCGVEVIVFDNHVQINAANLQAPHSIFSAHNDHRIVMALSILASRIGGQIEGAEAINKSYPTFFDDLSKVGIQLKKE